MRAELKAERVRQKNRGVAYKTSGNRATEPQAAVVSASGSPSGGIHETRAQLERQMKGMEEQANKMKEQHSHIVNNKAHFYAAPTTPTKPKSPLILDWPDLCTPPKQVGEMR